MARPWVAVVLGALGGLVLGWSAARATDSPAVRLPAGAPTDIERDPLDSSATLADARPPSSRRPADPTDLRAQLDALEEENRALVARLAELERAEASRAAQLEAVADCLDWLRALSPDAFGDMTAEQLLGTRELDLSELGLTDDDLARLTDLPALRRLTLRGCAVTDAGLVHLAEVPNLERLGLRSTQVTDDGMSALARAPNLNWLDLNLTAVGDAGVGALRDLDLTFLRLNYTQLTDAGLVHLPTLRKLERLDLWATRLTDPGLDVLHELPALKHLELGAVDVSQAWVEAFQAAHPDCYVRSKWGG